MLENKSYMIFKNTNMGEVEYIKSTFTYDEYKIEWNDARSKLIEKHIGGEPQRISIVSKDTILSFCGIYTGGCDDCIHIDRVSEIHEIPNIDKLVGVFI